MGVFSSECSKCGSKDHAIKDCPHGIFSSKCRKCGSTEHSTSECPHGIFSSKCNNCGSKDHATSDCPHGIFSSKCSHCGSTEHASNGCPHGIFSSKCSKCGSKNHSTADCPQGMFARASSRSSRSASSSSLDNYNSGNKIIGLLIVLGIVVFVVIWLAVNVVLPVALLNSALTLTAFAILKKDRKKIFSILALVGGAYILFDIFNGWFSANFVNNVVKDNRWISAFAYINSTAVGLSTWFLVEPLWTKAKLLGISENKKRITLMGSSILLVVIATLSIPILYNTIQNPFAQNASWSNSNKNNYVAPKQEINLSNNTVTNNSSSPTITVTKTLKGSVGKLEAIYSLNWYSDGTINGTYNYPAQPNIIYTLQGRDLQNGALELTEYVNSNISANCNLTLQGNCYVGQMNYTDGRHIKMTMCEGPESTAISSDAFYIVNVAAVKTESQAIEKAAELKRTGNPSGYLWIPDYASLSGAQFYSVYIGPYSTQYDCEVATEDFRKNHPEAYGLLVSQDRKRVQINGIGKVTVTKK